MTEKAVIYGPPLTDQRPRHRGFVRTYDPRGTAKLEIRKDIQKQLDAGEIHRVSGPISVTVLLWEPIPSSITREERCLMSHGVITRMSNKDVDNYAKLILDCCNGLLWDDDHNIVQLVVMKTYGDNPREEIIVERAQIPITPREKAVMSKITAKEMDRLVVELASFSPNDAVERIARISEEWGDVLAKIGKQLKK